MRPERLIDCHVVNIDCVTLRAIVHTLPGSVRRIVRHCGGDKLRGSNDIKISRVMLRRCRADDETKNIFDDIFIQMCGSHANSMAARSASVFIFTFFCFVCWLLSIDLLLMSCHDMRVRWNIRANVCNQLNVSVRFMRFLFALLSPILPHIDLFAVRIETHWRQSPSPHHCHRTNRFVLCAFEPKHFICHLCRQLKHESASSVADMRPVRLLLLRGFRLHMFIYLIKIISKAFSDFWCSFSSFFPSLPPFSRSTWTCSTFVRQ